MSMSTFVIGIRPPNKQWLAMKAVWDACMAAGIDSFPKEVKDFFAGEEPNPKGVVVGIEKALTEVEDPNGAELHYDVDITKLPKDVTVVRFTNSW